MDYENGQIEPEASPPKVYKLPPEELDTEFKKEFPPDPVIGSEMNDTARVWKVYRREAMAVDSTLLEGWSSTLDILLIFAGLFSAVATAFVIESYQLLQPDNAAYSAVALYILVSASSHTTGITLPPPPDLAFASPVTRWINGLWFTSILLSLTVALLSILVKQWITEYRARNNASSQSARHWAHRHWLFSQALRAWPVAELVSFLPVLLHLSLFLFFAGVIAFLWSLDRAIGVWIVVLGLSLAIFYVACTLIPVWIPECPTSTPLVAQMRKFLVPAALVLLSAFLDSYALALRLRGRMRNCWERLEWIAAHANQLRRTDDGTVPTTAPRSGSEPITLPTHFQRMAHRLEALRRDKPVIHRQLDQQQTDNRDASALCWLIEEVPDSDAVAVALQAVGAIHPASTLAHHLRHHGNIVNFTEETAYTKSAAAAGPAEALRVMRSTLCMRRGLTKLSRTWYSTLDSDYPDIQLLTQSGPIDLDGIGRLLQYSTDSLSSTAILRLSSELDLFRKLSCLACYDFQSLSPDVDRDLILDLLCSDADVRLLDRPPPSSSLDPMHNIADLLAHIALTSPFNGIRHVAAQLVPRLLCAVIDWTGPSTQTLSLQSSVLEFLVSGVFRGEDYTSTEMVWVSVYLSRVARDAIPNDATMTNFWRAVASVAARDTHIVFPITVCYAKLDACSRSDSELPGTLTGILGSSSQVAAGIPSMWKLLNRPRPNDFIILAERVGAAERLSAAVCTYARRYGERQCADFIDLYFADLVVASIWEYLHTASSSARRTCQHLIQHCIELRPQWWLDLLSHIWLKWPEEEWCLAMELDREVSRLGPCLHCPQMTDMGTGVPICQEGISEDFPPLGWCGDADCEDSSCGFLP